MTFVLPSDPAYQRAKALKRGDARLDAVFDPFVAAFAETFGFPPFAVGVDTQRGAAGGVSRPRLGVVLERTADCLSFHRRRERHSGYDARKQHRVAGLFVDAMAGVDLRALFGMPRRTAATYGWRDELFVYFADFESVAEQEAYGLVSETEIDTWAGGLGLGAQLWCTRRFTGPPIVFVHTDEQAAVLRASPAPASWAASYFEVVTAHDEFGYLTPADIAIGVDSKENFDTRFESNWFYYWR